MRVTCWPLIGMLVLAAAIRPTSAVAMDAQAVAASAARLEYCNQLFAMVQRYNHKHQHNRVSFSPLWQYRCQQGRYDDGIPELTILLQQSRHVVPPPPPTSVTAHELARE